jgi:hypothetical protein
VTIFISIAAYRDPELVPTIEHALARARWPGELRFGVCWQHGAGEAPPPALDGGRMRVIDVPWRESGGACWARAEVMKLHDGEDWFLQLDSHHRFADGWDAILLDQAEKSGAARPVLTTYAAPYDPAATLSHDPAPTRMRFDCFTAQGIPTFQFGDIAAAERNGAPIRARFVSGHLLFAPASFITDVPYDPELYFIGEEISLAVRAFTHGYDLFHPGAHVAWHEYTRLGRTKHWDDHVAGNPVAQPWHERDAVSLAKVQRFLTVRPIGPFACGDQRSVDEYEVYAGIDFRRRTATMAARHGDTPATPRRGVPGGAIDRPWTVRLALDQQALPPAARDDPKFWYVGFHDAEGVEIARNDANRAEMRAVLASGVGPIVLERRFVSARPPARWTIWPTDRQGRWLDKLDGAIDASGSAGDVIMVGA